MRQIFPDGGGGGQSRGLDAGSIVKMRRVRGLAQNEIVSGFVGSEAGKRGNNLAQGEISDASRGCRGE